MDQGVKLWEHWASLGVGVGGVVRLQCFGDIGEVSHRASLPGELHFPKGPAAHSGVRRKDMLRPSPFTAIVPKTRHPDWRALALCILGLVVQRVHAPSSFVIRGAHSALQARPREADPNRVPVRRALRADRRPPRGGASFPRRHRLPAPPFAEPGPPRLPGATPEAVAAAAWRGVASGLRYTRQPRPYVVISAAQAPPAPPAGHGFPAAGCSPEGATEM